MLESTNKINLAQHSFLVTGGAGFIGSNLVEFLMDNDAKFVRVLDNFSTGNLDNIKKFFTSPRFELLTGDIRDIETCKKAVVSIDYVSHQAALGSVPRSISDPLTTNEVNISGFLNVLNVIKNSQVKKLVYAASSSTYGDSLSLPKVENTIGKPLSPYAVTKFVNELYAQVFADLYKINSIGLRYFNVFGPKQNPDGEYAAVIPLFMKSVLSNTAPYINGDGEQTRDFTFVQNAVHANIQALMSKTKGHEVINIAFGERTSLNQLWKYISEIGNSKLDPLYRSSRLGDVRDSLADISKAKELINYNPTVSIQQGLKTTFDWYLAHGK
ncbi:MAG: LPS biosynthesis protein WbpP [Sphingobacteriales bacterium 17-39-43]|nr:MAG: LPS biosynthesis protein WbpP [Sphingobacteriales bacterium 16-39-50]OZA22956.1 MAG: LPS biosynthesis protein WbpP [Sphingobacteriales bacterium 17-39-43]